MANTTNYNWETPDDTDLVKDGAAAIRTLGSSIDTTTKNLNPQTTTGAIAYRSATANVNTALPIGTNGQILAVSGGVPAWINNDQGDITEVQAGVGISIASGTGPIPVITNSSTDLITTAGDILYGTAADTVARLGIGTAGQVLKVNSGATAPEWGAASAGMTFISKTSWSAAASHTVDSVFTSTYTNYMIVIENWISNSYLNIPQIQLRYGSSTEAASYYGSSFGTAYNSGTLVHQGTSNAAACDFWRYSGEAQGTFIAFHIDSVGTGGSVEASITGQGAVNTNAEQYKFGFQATTARNYTGFILKTSAGTSSGNVTVYGLAKA
jgi:hypothetical protein